MAAGTVGGTPCVDIGRVRRLYCYRRVVAVAQLAERQIVALEVVGSRPIGHPNRRAKLRETGNVSPGALLLYGNGRGCDRNLSCAMSVRFGEEAGE